MVSLYLLGQCLYKIRQTEINLQRDLLFSVVADLEVYMLHGTLQLENKNSEINLVEQLVNMAKEVISKE